MTSLTLPEFILAGNKPASDVSEKSLRLEPKWVFTKATPSSTKSPSWAVLRNPIRFV